jgi:L-rhamnose mutarotase
MTSRHLLILDLKDDPVAISAYEKWHLQVWPDILKGIREAGIEEMQIYRAGNRLVMLLETTPDFDFIAKAKADAENPRVQEWEALMDQFQQRLPFAESVEEKWIPLKVIFSLKKSLAHV